MKGKRLALYTFGVFRAPANDAVNQGFHDRNDRNLIAVELSEGFIARSGYDDEPGPESWGAQVFRAFTSNVETVGHHRPYPYGRTWPHRWHSLTLEYMRKR